ncbi:MAG: ABC transporter substrate-binding protein [Spirochaetia bacterium]
MKRIIISFFIVSLCLTPVFAGGTGEETREEETLEQAQENEIPVEPFDVIIGTLRGPSGIGMSKLMHDDPPFVQNAEVEYQVIGAPDVMIQRLISGEIEIASLPLNVGAKLYNSGMPVRMGAITGFGVLYMLANNGDISSWEDLEGRTIYNIARGSTPDLLMQALLEFHGLGDSVTMDFRYSHPELAQTMIADMVDLAVLPEPFATMVLSQNEDVEVVLDLQEEWQDAQGSQETYPMTCIMIHTALIEEQPAFVEAFLTAYEDSIQWVNANPAEAAPIVEEAQIGMNAVVAEAAIPRCNLRFVDAEDAAPIVEPFLQVFLDISPAAIGGSMPDEGFYYY